jgi:hypothetical protein
VGGTHVGLRRVQTNWLHVSPLRKGVLHCDAVVDGCCHRVPGCMG